MIFNEATVLSSFSVQRYISPVTRITFKTCLVFTYESTLWASVLLLEDLIALHDQLLSFTCPCQLLDVSTLGSRRITAKRLVRLFKKELNCYEQMRVNHSQILSHLLIIQLLF